MKKKLTTFEKLLVKIQTGDWDDLAYLSMSIEQNCFTGRDVLTKNDIAVQEKLLSLIEERKSQMFKHSNLKTIHVNGIKDMASSTDFESF